MVMEMAAFNPSSADRRLRRPVLMLKDYLLDDLGSCSSNGFKSFPRRPQCCPSTARFLIDIDLKVRGKTATRTSSRSRRVYSEGSLKRSPSKVASSAVSALHRASLKVINSVKLLTLPSIAKSASSVAGQSKSRRSLLPRSLSRKLMGKRFWRRAEVEKPEIGRRRPLPEYPAGDDRPPYQNTSGTVRTTTTPWFSTSSSSGSDWDSSELGPVDTVSTFSGNSVSPDGDSAASTEKDLHLPPEAEVEEEKTAGGVGIVSGRVGVTVGGNEEEESPAATPTAARSKDWPNVEEEQFSPVSVLDCPFKDDDDDDDDDDEEISSTPEYCRVHIGGVKNKHDCYSHRSKSLSQLEPLNLDRRLALSELNNGPIEPTPGSYSGPSSTEYIGESEINLKSEELLGAVKKNNPGIGLGEANLLSDFFIEKLESSRACELEALQVAEDWVNGDPRDLWTGQWEVRSGRAAPYLRDMEEKCGEGWRNVDEELQEVAVELEGELWRALTEEILLDL